MPMMDEAEGRELLQLDNDDLIVNSDDLSETQRVDGLTSSQSKSETCSVADSSLAIKQYGKSIRTLVALPAIPAGVVGKFSNHAISLYWLNSYSRRPIPCTS